MHFFTLHRVLESTVALWARGGGGGGHINCTPKWRQSQMLLVGACYGVVRFIMESGAKGCEVVVSGKLRGQRAKSMKFTDGFMIHSGYPIQEYIDMAVRHVYLRQGMEFFILIYFDEHFYTINLGGSWWPPS